MTPHEFVAWYRGYMAALDNACGPRKTAAVMTVALADIRRTAANVGLDEPSTSRFIQIPTDEP
jgi:hypothetical protein